MCERLFRDEASCPARNSSVWSYPLAIVPWIFPVVLARTKLTPAISIGRTLVKPLPGAILDSYGATTPVTLAPFSFRSHCAQDIRPRSVVTSPWFFVELIVSFTGSCAVSIPDPLERRWIMKSNAVNSGPKRHPAPPGTLSTLALLLAAILAAPANAQFGSQPGPTATAGSVARANVSLVAVTWGEGIWVTVGKNGTILHSLNAVDWTLCEPITDNDLRGVVHDRGMFVAVGDDGVILTSPDGIIWTKRDSSVTETLWAVAAGRGEFVAVGSNSTIVVSKNAKTWTKQRSCVVDDLRHILFSGNCFLIVGTQTIHTSSLTGRWSLANWPSPGAGSTISVGPHGFVGVERNGQLRTSSCGRKWRNPGILVPGRVLGLAGGGNQWVTVGEGGLTVASNDGVVWSEMERVTCADLRSVHHAHGQFVAVGDDATILVSDDTIHWEQVHP
jgi:hypothetical protein